MTFADASLTVQWIVLGLVIVGGFFWLRQSIGSLRTSTANNVTGTDDPEERETRTAGAIVNFLEVRLHSFASEAEARMGTRIEQLDRLISEADREINRLDALLAATQRPAQTGDPAISRDTKGGHEQMICHLHDAGYAVPEIAYMVGQTETTVRDALRAA